MGLEEDDQKNLSSQIQLVHDICNSEREMLVFWLGYRTVIPSYIIATIIAKQI
jgi:hypothetical protein